MLRLEGAIVGNLEQVLQQERQDLAEANTAGTHRAALALKQRLRDMVIAAFGSQRLANTWRGVKFPGGSRVSLGPTELVFSKAPHIMEAFSQTSHIAGQNGFWLAIPSPEALAMRTANKRVTPHDVEQRLGIKLQFVYRPGRASLLIANKVRRRTGKRGGFAKASASALKRGDAEFGVVMFFLVEVVTLKKRFDLEAQYAQAETEMVQFIFAEWEARQ